MSSRQPGVLAEWLSVATRFAESQPLTAAAFIFLLGFFVRLLILVVADTWPDNLTWEMTRVAQSVARGEGLSNPFAPGPTGPSAHVAPLYPLLIGAIYSVFGAGPVGDLVKQILSCAISSSIYALLPAIAASAGLPRLIGLLGGLLGAVAPASIELEVIGRWEAHFATLLFVIAIWLWFHDMREQGLSPQRGALSGVVWGALLLTSPSFALVLPGLAFVGFAADRRGARPLVLYLVAQALTIAAVLTPWTIRNYQQFGQILFVRDNAALELYVSNVPGAKLMLHDNMLGPGMKVHPNTDPATCKRVAAIGEIQFNRECMRNFISTVRSNPGEFASLTLRRFIWMWFPISENSIRDKMLLRDLFFCLLSLSGIIGYFTIPKYLRLTRWTFATVLICYPVAYYFVQAFTRYRFPIVWVMCLLSANLLVAVLSRRDQHRSESKPPSYATSYANN